MGYITNDAALDAANTAFEDAANDIFSGASNNVSDLFTTRTPQVGKFAELDLVDGIPQIREWVGSRQLKNLRAYSVTAPIKPWEMTIGIPVDDINGDRTGVVAARVRDFAARAERIYDQIMIPALLSNPECYDGVSLLSAAHERGSGLADQNNLTTDALNNTAFQAAMAAMSLFTDYHGEPVGITGTHVLVGPNQREVAFQVTGSDKIVGVDASGNYGGTIVDAGVLPNYEGGSVNVLVSDRIVGNQWFLMDLSKGRAKPLYAAEFQAPRTDILDSPTDSNVFHDDEVLYGLTAKITSMGMNWRTIFGSQTA